MAKRFTDTEKWDRPWFRDLPSAYRWLWIYILDKCDMAGVWHVDFKMANFAIGETVEAALAEEYFSKQITPFDSGSKWFIEDFIAFQYGTLSPDSKPHQAVLGLLKRHGLDTLWIGYPKGIHTLKDKDKDKDKVKDKEEGGVGETKPMAGKPVNRDELRKIVRAYKILTGYEKDDKEWDKLNYARCLKSAKALLTFIGNWRDSVDCLQDVYEKFTSKGLTVTIETVLKHAADWRRDKREKEAKNGIHAMPRNGIGSFDPGREDPPPDFGTE